MATSLGKRKRQDTNDRRKGGSDSGPSSVTSESEAESFQDIFKRHFESHFAPLEVPQRQENGQSWGANGEEKDSDELSDWSGLPSEDEGHENVVHQETLPQTGSLAKVESKRFMSTKPPAFGHATTVAKPASTQEDKAENNEGFNLQNDLALQRLISESHLLDSSHRPSSAQSRQRILDKRMQDLGSKKPILAQDKMPMSHRKGIIAKTNEREERRRQEAKENGIVLEKSSKPKKSRERRLQGVGGPAVGKFKGGTLNLSRRDVASIQKSRVDV